MSVQPVLHPPQTWKIGDSEIEVSLNVDASGTGFLDLKVVSGSREGHAKLQPDGEDLVISVNEDPANPIRTEVV